MKPLITILVPAYNEQQVLPLFHQRIIEVMDALDYAAEILYVNDGSSDQSLAIMRQLQANDARVSVLDLSRNFGKEIAMSAGLDFAKGDAVIIIDADLQDPPELIPSFLKQWQLGYDVVYGQRLHRDGESAFKKLTAFGFYRVIRAMSHIEIPADTGDFRLLSRRAVDALKQLPERNRFMKGLYAWIGYRQTAVTYRRNSRQAGITKWNYWRLWNFALEGITSFSEIPLKVSSYLGLLIAVVSFAYGTVIITKTLIFGATVQGYPSLMTVILFLGGVQLMSLGVFGEYLGRMFMESKNRPLYLIEDYQAFKQPDNKQQKPAASHPEQE
jgi:glycosyltransferase involved in cell wall biosynthesis